MVAGVLLATWILTAALRAHDKITWPKVYEKYDENVWRNMRKDVIFLFRILRKPIDPDSTIRRMFGRPR